MTVKDLEALFNYSYWANRHLFGVLSQLTDEQFVAPVAGSYGSIRNTLVHIMSAEWGWVDRCGGPPRGPALKGTDYPTFASVRDQWEQVEGFLRSIHGVHHRGQVALLLRQLGHVPGNFDFLFYE